MPQILAIGLAVLLVTGCAAYAPINTAALSVGMSKQAAIEVLGGRGDTVGSRVYDDGVVDVIEINRRSNLSSDIVETYWLYFLDNELETWDSPGDWQREADQIYEARAR